MIMTTGNIIKTLTKLNRGWPSNLSLYANNGLLMLIDEADNRRVVWTFDDIRADGGDLTTVTSADGFEHLNTKWGGE